MPRTSSVSGLGELLAKQSSVVSRGQLLALMHHSIRSGQAIDVIDVLVPAERRRLATGFVRVHRTARMPARASSVGPVRLALVPRAVADTVRQLTELRDARAVVADAVQLGRCTVRQLAEELRDGPVQALRRCVRSSVRWPTASGPQPKVTCAT